MAAFYLLCKDSKYVKAEKLFQMYSIIQKEDGVTPRGALNQKSIKEMFENLYFVVIYALPNLIGNDHGLQEEVKLLKTQM